MSTILVSDLHTTTDPDTRLAQYAAVARAGDEPHRLIVRCPDRQTDGIRALQITDVAAILQRHARIREIGVTDGGTIVAAADVCRRRGEVAIWTGWAIGPWHPSDIVTRGLGGSETAAVRLAEALAAMGYVVSLYGQFDEPGHGRRRDAPRLPRVRPDAAAARADHLPGRAPVRPSPQRPVLRAVARGSARHRGHHAGARREPRPDHRRVELAQGGDRGALPVPTGHDHPEGPLAHGRGP